MLDSEKMSSLIIKIVGAIAIMLSLILFFMITSERDTSHWMGLIFLLASQVMFFFGSTLITQKKPEYNATLLTTGTVSILALYMGLTLILALLSGLFTNVLSIYMVLQLTFFLVTVILTLLLYAFSHKVNKDIEKILLERDEAEKSDKEK